MFCFTDKFAYLVDVYVMVVLHMSSYAWTLPLLTLVNEL